MAYSALEKMRKKNFEIYGQDVGPKEPELYCDGNRNSLKYECISTFTNRNIFKKTIKIINKHCSKNNDIFPQNNW